MIVCIFATMENPKKRRIKPQENKMNLYKATIEDYQSVISFYDDVTERTPDMVRFARWQKGKHPTAEGIRAYIEKGSMYLYQEDDAIVGAMAVTMYQDEDYHAIAWSREVNDDEVAVIHILAVSPDRQGAGIGSEMVREAVRLARRNGMKAIRLDALASNTPAHRLYEKLGFEYKGKQYLFAENTMWTDFYFFEYNKQEDGGHSSERIVLRPWQDSDAAALYKYASDPEVGPRAGWPPHQSVEESLEIIRTVFNTPTMWAVEWKATGEAIGCVGYLPASASNLKIEEDQCEVGYWIGRSYWDNGICTEALRMVVNHCFEEKGFTLLWGSYFPSNPASGRVMEKCGFVDTGVETRCPKLEVGADLPVKVMKLELRKWQEDGDSAKGNHGLPSFSSTP